MSHLNYGYPDIAVTDYRNTLLVRIVRSGLAESWTVASESSNMPGHKSGRTVEMGISLDNEIIVDKNEASDGSKLSMRLQIFGAALQRFLAAGFKLPEDVLIKADPETSPRKRRWTKWQEIEW